MPRLDPDVAATRSAVRAWLNAGAGSPRSAGAESPLNAGAGSPRSAGAELPGSVLVACSGGADSLALAAAAAFEAPRAGVSAGAVVVDHGLLADSATVAERAAAQCRALGLDPVFVRAVRVGVAGGPEGAARDARYAELERVAAERGARVLLGHTADDQAETVLLRLARGSGTRSLAGMAPERGVFARPFLALRRADLRAACQAQGLTWWEDPTNDPAGPLRRADGGELPRAAVRERVLPALAAALGADPVPPLARTAALAREDADLLDALAADLLAAARRERGEGARLDVGALQAAPGPLRRRALRAWLIAAGAPAGAIGLEHVVVVDHLVTRWRGQRGVDVPGDLRVRRAGDGLEVAPRAALL